MTSEQQWLVRQLSAEFFREGEHASFEAALREVLQTQRATGAPPARETRRFTFEVVVETDSMTANREAMSFVLDRAANEMWRGTIEVRPTKEERLRPGVRVVEWAR